MVAARVSGVAVLCTVQPVLATPEASVTSVGLLTLPPLRGTKVTVTPSTGFKN